MTDPVLDLLLGSRCTVCQRPGRLLCHGCRRGLPTGAATCWPTPSPPGLARPVAAGEYDGALKLLVNAHKEERRFALAGPLGDLLALSVAELADPARGPGSVMLVPVPARGAVVRRRGHDPLLRITMRCASRLRAHGVPTSVARLLRSTRPVADQAGLGAADRARNLEHSMSCPAGRAGRAMTAGRAGETSPVVVVVDDVLTTGATVREAQRALEHAGLPVSGIAVVAATRRTVIRPLVHPPQASPAGGRVNPALRLPFSSGGH